MAGMAIILSLPGLFRTIITLVFIYLIIRTIVLLFALRIKTNEGRKSRQADEFGEPNPDKHPKAQKLIGKDQGEYVDFEEVK